MKKILILHDSMPEINQLINLGDRAIANGFYEILTKNFNCEIISGGRKNFPYFNKKKFKDSFSSIEIENKFNQFLNLMLEENAFQVRLEKNILKILRAGQVLNNPLSAKLNNWFTKKYTRNLINTITPFLLKKINFNEQIQKIRSADLVVTNSGGLISDHLEFYLPSYLFEAFLAKSLGKTVISMNQSISIQKPLNLKMVSFVYKMMDFHLTREPFSGKALIDMGIDKDRVIASCDSAFAADYRISETEVERMVQKNKLDNSDGGIGLAIRGDRPVDYEQLTDLINLIKHKYHKKVYFISTCKAHDMDVYRNLSKKCDIFFLHDANDYRMIVQLMKYLDLIITDRYHMAIFSIIAPVPVLALKTQSLKMDGLFQLLDYPFPVRSFSDLEPGEFINEIGQIFYRKNEIKQLLAVAGPRLREKALNDVKRIKDYFIDQP